MEEDRFCAMREQGCISLELVIAVLCSGNKNGFIGQEDGTDADSLDTQEQLRSKKVNLETGQGRNILKLPDQLCRDIYPELLKRLDDAENKVRIAACKTFSAFIERMPDSFDATHVQYITYNLLVHMDDADSAVQEAVCAAACGLANVHPQMLNEELRKVRGVHRDTKYCDKIFHFLTDKPS